MPLYRTSFFTATGITTQRGKRSEMANSFVKWTWMSSERYAARKCRLAINKKLMHKPTWNEYTKRIPAKCKASAVRSRFLELVLFISHITRL